MNLVLTVWFCISLSLGILLKDMRSSLRIDLPWLAACSVRPAEGLLGFLWEMFFHFTSGLLTLLLIFSFSPLPWLSHFLSSHLQWKYYTYWLVGLFYFFLYIFLFFYIFVRYLFYHLFLRNQVLFSIVIKLRLKDDLTFYHLFRRALLNSSIE